MKIGILSLQGAVELHKTKLSSLGAEPIEVRRAEHLQGLAGLILPGGESTTMLHLLRLNELWEPLKAFTRQRPTWGICAGAILLAGRVSSPSQASLEAMNIEIERNAYGRQRDSFIDTLEPAPGSSFAAVEGVFIRAPKIRAVSKSCKVLLNWHEEPVLVEEGALLASTFHPELTSANDVHGYFLKKTHG